MEKETKTYDQAVKRIEEILELLESGDKGMDELGELVKEASQLMKFCKERLRKTEEEIGEALSGDDPEA